MVHFEKFELENGLRIIVHQDKTTPMVAMNLIYMVGSRDEYPDKTGFAHLFEHLMFGGSANIPKFDEPLQMAGGENNAFTNNDFTNYYLTIPKNNLETAFWLESDRMLSLNFTKKSLEVQRQVVIEEFKQNYLNQPYGDAYLLLKPLVYQEHPYRWNTIGKEISHIEQATMDDIKHFYSKFYNPDNAILSIAGDVTFDEIKTLSEKWFGDIPRGEKIIRDYPMEPIQEKARILEVERLVPQNTIYTCWHMPARTDDSFYIIDLLSDLLSNGNSSRLYQELVKKKQVFSTLSAFVTGDLDPGLFIVTGKLMNDTGREESEEALYRVIEQLIKEGPTEDELQKVKNKIEANLTFSRLSVLNKAMSLGYYEMLGDANFWNVEIDQYRKIMQIDIKEMAQQLFCRSKQNTLFYKAINN